MTDKQIIDEERLFECVWCKYEYPESVARVILSSEPNECVCNGCLDEWIDDMLCQLKRKEQECEELKSNNLQEVGQLKFAIGTLTAENLHLKELLDMRIEALCDSCKAGSMLPIKCRIYEKTLTEIKEIARVGAFYWKHYKEESKRYNEILQKISECEVEDD